MFFQKILSLSMVIIQERFLIKSGFIMAHVRYFVYFDLNQNLLAGRKNKQKNGRSRFQDRLLSFDEQDTKIIFFDNFRSLLVFQLDKWPNSDKMLN